MIAELTDINRKPFDDIVLDTGYNLKCESLNTPEGMCMIISCVQASINRYFMTDIPHNPSFILRQYFDNQVLWIETPRMNIIAVRGTLSSDDMWTNLQAWQTRVRMCNGVYAEGKFHYGFQNRACELGMRMNEFATYLRTYRKPVIFTGHSMGGAIASALKVYFSPLLTYIHTTIMTFGMPRIGDYDALNEVSSSAQSIHVLNSLDIVTQVPSSVFPDVRGRWLYTYGRNVKYIEFQTGSWLGNHSLDNYKSYIEGDKQDFVWSI
jgi:hypothetical protein